MPASPNELGISPEHFRPAATPISFLVSPRSRNSCGSAARGCSSSSRRTRFRDQQKNARSPDPYRNNEIQRDERTPTDVIAGLRRGVERFTGDRRAPDVGDPFGFHHCFHSRVECMAQRDLDDPPECDRLVRARDLGRGSPDIVDWARPATRVRSGRQSYCGRRCRPGRAYWVPLRQHRHRRQVGRNAGLTASTWSCARGSRAWIFGRANAKRRQIAGDLL